MSWPAGPFGRDEIERFVADGHLLLRAAIPRELAARCRDWMWRAAKLDPDDPASWTEPVVRIYGSTDPVFAEAMNVPALHAALDQLVGVGRWQRPIQGTGSFPIRFPSERDPGDAGWHIDGSYTVDGQLFVNFYSRDRALLMLILFSDVGVDDAPTRIRRGSHLLVPPVLEPIGEEGVSFGDVFSRLQGVDELPLDLATGEAGDILLCHPFLVHAASWPHRGSTPRFIAQPGLMPRAPLELDRADGNHSPVERAIRRGLGRGEA
jgi:hypothetical protein